MEKENLTIELEIIKNKIKQETAKRNKSDTLNSNIEIIIKHCNEKDDLKTKKAYITILYLIYKLLKINNSYQ